MGRKKGRKEGRREGGKEGGREGGRKGGSKEARKEGRREGSFPKNLVPLQKYLQFKKEVLNKSQLSCYHQIRDIRRV